MEQPIKLLLVKDHECEDFILILEQYLFFTKKDKLSFTAPAHCVCAHVHYYEDGF